VAIRVLAFMKGSLGVWVNRGFGWLSATSSSAWDEL